MPALTFPETDAVLKRPLIRAHHRRPLVAGRQDDLLGNVDSGTDPRRCAGYRHNDASTDASGGQLRRTKADAEISIRPAPAATLVFRPESFVRSVAFFTPCRSRGWIGTIL